MKVTIALILTLLKLTFSFASGEEDSVNLETARRKPWYTPHYVPLQFAVNIGFLSTGVGYGARKDRYQLSLVYGYVPPSVGGVRVHMLTAKNIFHISRFFLNKKQTLLPYGAMGLNYEIGGRSFFKQPANMPPSYYDFPKSVHLIVSGGLKLRCMTDKSKTLRGYEFFGETTTADAYIWYKIRSEDIKMYHILSFSLGIHLLRK